MLPILATIHALSDVRQSRDAAVALYRFSGFGHFAVAIVLVTGAINTRLVLNAWPLDLQSPYQTLLLIKITSVVLMVSLAIINRYVLVPHLRNRGENLRLLRLSTFAELSVGLIVVGLISVIGILLPA
jgi:putative copper resistance protein D